MASLVAIGMSLAATGCTLDAKKLNGDNGSLCQGGEICGDSDGSVAASDATRGNDANPSHPDASADEPDASSPPDAAIPITNYVCTVTLQAEDATLNIMEKEAVWPGYTGSGYAAGYLANTESVQFTLSMAAAGTGNLALRYSSGDGDATREIQWNGVAQSSSLPDTEQWTTWSVRNYNGLAFQSGGNSLRVRFLNGNAHFVNIDKLDVLVTTTAPVAGANCIAQ